MHTLTAVQVTTCSMRCRQRLPLCGAGDDMLYGDALVTTPLRRRQVTTRSTATTETTSSMCAGNTRSTAVWRRHPHIGGIARRHALRRAGKRRPPTAYWRRHPLDNDATIPSTRDGITHNIIASTDDTVIEYCEGWMASNHRSQPNIDFLKYKLMTGSGNRSLLWRT